MLLHPLVSDGYLGNCCCMQVGYSSNPPVFFGICDLQIYWALHYKVPWLIQLSILPFRSERIDFLFHHRNTISLKKCANKINEMSIFVFNWILETAFKWRSENQSFLVRWVSFINLLFIHVYIICLLFWSSMFGFFAWHVLGNYK